MGRNRFRVDRWCIVTLVKCTPFDIRSLALLKRTFPQKKGEAHLADSRITKTLLALSCSGHLTTGEFGRRGVQTICQLSTDKQIKRSRSELQELLHPSQDFFLVDARSIDRPSLFDLLCVCVPKQSEPFRLALRFGMWTPERPNMLCRGNLVRHRAASSCFSPFSRGLSIRKAVAIYSLGAIKVNSCQFVCLPRAYPSMHCTSLTGFILLPSALQKRGRQNDRALRFVKAKRTTKET